MAADQQIATASAEVLPFNTYPAEERRWSNIPHSRVVHRGTLELDGSGAGDTADLRLTLPLGGRDVYQLNTVQLWMQNGANTIEYGKWAALELYLLDRPSEAFGTSTQMNIGVQWSDNYETFVGAGINQRFGGLGYLVEDSAAPNVGGSAPGWITDPGRLHLLGSDLGGTDPVYVMSAGTSTNVNANTQLRYWFEWLMYDFEQCLNMPLHYRTPVR